MIKEYYIKCRAVGGKGGNVFGEPHIDSTDIQIRSGKIIDAIHESWTDKESKPTTQKYGGTGGTESDKIPTASIRKISIEVEREPDYDSDVVISRIVINDNMFGRQEGSYYSYEIPNNWKFAGFHGKSGNYINSLGIYMQCPPFKDDKANIYYNMTGIWYGNSFSFWTKDKIKEIAFLGDDNSISGIAFQGNNIGSKSGKTETVTLPDNFSNVKLTFAGGMLLGIEFIDEQGKCTGCKKNNQFPPHIHPEVPYEFSIPMGFRLAGFYGFNHSGGIYGLGLIIRPE